MKNLIRLKSLLGLTCVVTAMYFIPVGARAGYPAFTYAGVNYEITDPGAKNVRTMPGNTASEPGTSVSGALNLLGIAAYEGVFYTLDEIGYNSFCANPELLSVSIVAERLTEIGMSAFEKCPKLASVSIQTGSDYSLGIQAFDNCTGLRSVDLGPNVTSIGMNAFWNCEQLEEIHIPSKVTELGEYAFQYCESLKKVTFSTTKLAWLRTAVFAGCNSMHTLILPAYGLTDIGQRAFQGCHALESLTVPNSVKFIGDFAFNECESMKALYIGDGVERIGDAAFAACYALEALRLGPNIREIGTGAFSGNKKIFEVELPATLESVGKLAFSGYYAMRKVVCGAVTPPEAGSYMFNEATYNEAVLYVPAASVEAYKAHAEWGKFLKIADIESMSAGITDTEIPAQGRTEIFNLDGARVGATADELPRGIYIIRHDGRAQKVLVR